MIFISVTLPVLISGDYDSVFFIKNYSYGSKKLYFYITLVIYPYVLMLFPQLKCGNYSFYKERLEISPFILKKKYIFSYSEIHALLYKIELLDKKSLVISRSEIPNFTKSPLKKIINEYIKGFYIILYPGWLKDSSKVDQAIELIKNNSASFRIK